MQNPVSTLLSRSIAEQLQRNQNALEAIEARSRDIGVLDHLTGALRARGWRADAYVDTTPSGNAAACNLALLLSCNESELAGALEYLAADGVGISRDVRGDMGCSRQYRLRLATFVLRLHAYVHAPERAAA